MAGAAYDTRMAAEAEEMQVAIQAGCIAFNEQWARIELELQQGGNAHLAYLIAHLYKYINNIEERLDNLEARVKILEAPRQQEMRP